MRERTLETGSIDKLQSAKPAQLRQFRGDQAGLLVVLRIFLFGDVAADPVEWNLGVAAIPVMNSRLFAAAVADFRDHGRDRHNADGKDAASHEVVEETALASFESSQDGDADFA